MSIEIIPITADALTAPASKPSNGHKRKNGDVKKYRDHEHDEIAQLLPGIKRIIKSIDGDKYVAHDTVVTMANMWMALFDRIEPRARIARDSVKRQILYDTDVALAAEYVVPEEILPSARALYKEAHFKREALVAPSRLRQLEKKKLKRFAEAANGLVEAADGIILHGEEPPAEEESSSGGDEEEEDEE